LNDQLTSHDITSLSGNQRVEDDELLSDIDIMPEVKQSNIYGQCQDDFLYDSEDDGDDSPSQQELPTDIDPLWLNDEEDDLLGEEDDDEVVTTPLLRQVEAIELDDYVHEHLAPNRQLGCRSQLSHDHLNHNRRQQLSIEDQADGTCSHRFASCVNQVLPVYHAYGVDHTLSEKVISEDAAGGIAEKESVGGDIGYRLQHSRCGPPYINGEERLEDQVDQEDSDITLEDELSQDWRSSEAYIGDGIEEDDFWLDEV
jgi:hypothetical protein